MNTSGLVLVDKMFRLDFGGKTFGLYSWVKSLGLFLGLT